MEDWLDILENIKPLLSLLTIIIGHICRVCKKLQSMSVGERSEVDCEVVSAITYTREAMGRC